MEIEGTESHKKNDSIEINTTEIKNKWEKTTKFLKKRNVQIAITLVLFALILFTSVSIRLSGLPNLKDVTTGHYDMADPDAFYEFRVAQTIVNTGNINGIDTMRNPGLNLTYTKEMLPFALAYSYNFFHGLNSSITLDYIDVLYPIVAFALSLIIFFVLCWYLSKSKLLALIASTMLAYSPTFFQRTGAGISSHEALGMIFMLLSFLIYAFSVNNYKKSWKITSLLGIIIGISLSLSLYSWGGGSNFAIMMFPIASIALYFLNVEGKEQKKKFIIFNLLWVFSSILFMPLVGYTFSSMYERFFSNYGIIVPFSLVFMFLDFILEYNPERIKYGKSKYRILYSLIGTVLIGFIGLFVIGRSPFGLISSAYNQLLYPFGQTRVGLTVAYYAQPYTTDLISQLGTYLFWIFFLGMVFIGLEFGKNINQKKYKLYFYAVWIFTICGMLFSRISSSSTLNGTNFISQLFYVLSFMVFGFYLIWMYLKDKFKVNSETVFLSAWMVVMLMSARSAIRVLFVIVAFTFVAIAYFTIKSYEYGKKTGNKSMKYFFLLIFITALLIIFVFNFGNPLIGTSGNYQSISNAAKYSGPITDTQWQNAMAWVRNNTAANSVFVSWWDYGYQIQTLGERATVVDGGNANVYWDHMVGRYLLTEPNANASLSFMKTHNVSYLLIDPTDIGKYPAFSTIGSDASGQDRASYIPSLVLNPSQTQETNDSEILVYSGGMQIDGDIIYNQTAGGQVFLPKETTVLAGIILTVTNTSSSSLSLKQPQAVFINTQSQQQVYIPLRYAYFNGKIADFRGGLDAGVDVIPSIGQTSTGSIQINNLGALMYLSPKVFNSLFAQLYLMGDPFNRYPTLKVANIQEDSIVSSLNAQGASISGFVYANGVRAPLKIWKVSYPKYIIPRPEFLSPSGAYGAFDNLTFTS